MCLKTANRLMGALRQRCHSTCLATIHVLAYWKYPDGPLLSVCVDFPYHSFMRTPRELARTKKKKCHPYSLDILMTFFWYPFLVKFLSHKTKKFQTKQVSNYCFPIRKNNPLRARLSTYRFAYRTYPLNYLFFFRCFRFWDTDQGVKRIRNLRDDTTVNGKRGSSSYGNRSADTRLRGTWGRWRRGHFACEYISGNW